MPFWQAHQEGRRLPAPDGTLWFWREGEKAGRDRAVGFGGNFLLGEGWKQWYVTFDLAFLSSSSFFLTFSFSLSVSISLLPFLPFLLLPLGTHTPPPFMPAGRVVGGTCVGLCLAGRLVPFTFSQEEGGRDQGGDTYHSATTHLTCSFPFPFPHPSPDLPLHTLHSSACR